MRFLVDQNLPAVLAAWLIDRGHDASHVRLLGLQEADDAEIAALARVQSAVVISKDADFARRGDGSLPVQVVWVRIGNTTNDALIAAWTEVWPEIL
jgi:predicted nuclease of predicted toxin-antitoxin system